MRGTIMSPPLVSVLLFSFLVLSFLPLSASQSSVLSRGSSLSVEKDADVLVSPDGAFTCGFHSVGTNAVAFSIWFTASLDKTPVWTATRDRPVNGHGSRLTLRRDGALVLTDADKSVAWSTNTSSTAAATAELLDTGNLVVKDAGGGILWQSFGWPTTTLLPKQPMTKTTKLVSSMTWGTLSSGYYAFYFDNDNVLKLMYDGPEVSSLYWPNPELDIFGNGRTPYNSSRYAVLDETGKFTSSDQLSFNASDAGREINRRLALDPDGNLRLYSLNKTGGWQVSWQAMPQVCNVHGQCGKNGICVWTPEPKCFCPPGHEMADPTSWKSGCKRKVPIACGRPGPWRFVEIPNTDFYGYDTPGYNTNVSFDSCRKTCEDDCSCQAFVYKRDGWGACYPKNLLFNGRTSPNFPGSAYLKLPRSAESSNSSAPAVSEIVCNSTRVEAVTPLSGELYGRRKGSTKWAYMYAFVSVFGLIEVLFIAAGWWFVHGRHRSQRSMEEGYRMISTHFSKFSYRELKRATENFKHELGRGGAGAVYKGVLEDQRVVAVKKLDNVLQGAEEFQAEMSLVGRINHMNLVRVWGFCSEGSHRLLVSKYQERGSLAKVLFDNGDSAAPPLEWGKRYKIALGAARGLAYLHHECLEWIVHCDVKPENILLDGDFDPKIADFGLAKLSQRGAASHGVHFSGIRGTKGYMAPEWIMNFPITAKVDVYSYGVVLLEIVMGRQISTAVVAEGEEWEVAELRRLVRGVKEKVGDGEGGAWVVGFVDPRLEGQFNRKQAGVMLELAASCLEEDKNWRPSMDLVAETLRACGSETET